jgi:hypothetical protein
MNSWNEIISRLSVSYNYFYFSQLSEDEQLNFIDCTEKMPSVSNGAKESIVFVNGEKTWQLINNSARKATNTSVIAATQYKIPLSHREIVTIQTPMLDQQESQVWQNFPVAYLMKYRQYSHFT